MPRLRTCRWRAEVNKHLGVDSRVVGPEEIARALPMMDMTRRRPCAHPRRAVPRTGRGGAA